jgi:protein-disulfide isomerase
MSNQTRPKSEALRKARQETVRREARQRRLIGWVGGLVIVALIVAIAVVVVNAVGGDDEGPVKASGELVAPANVTADGTIPVGREDAPVAVTIYFDYMCPYCGRFEAANGEELTRLIEGGDARVELHAMSFLDPQSDGSEYSTRSANALATVADAAPDQVWEFHEALYASQPEEGTPGLTDDQIANLARDAGVPIEVVDRFSDRTFEPWVADVTQQAFDSGVSGTPTVLIDGEEFTGDLYTRGSLTEAIEAAAGAAQ